MKKAGGTARPRRLPPSPHTALHHTRATYVNQIAHGAPPFERALLERRKGRAWLAWWGSNCRQWWELATRAPALPADNTARMRVPRTTPGSMELSRRRVRRWGPTQQRSGAHGAGHGGDASSRDDAHARVRGRYPSRVLVPHDLLSASSLFVLGLFVPLFVAFARTRFLYFAHFLQKTRSADRDLFGRTGPGHTRSVPGRASTPSRTQFCPPNSLEQAWAGAERIFPP